MNQNHGFCSRKHRTHQSNHLGKCMAHPVLVNPISTATCPIKTVSILQNQKTVWSPGMWWAGSAKFSCGGVFSQSIAKCCLSLAGLACQYQRHCVWFGQVKQQIIEQLSQIRLDLQSQLPAESSLRDYHTTFTGLPSIPSSSTIGTTGDSPYQQPICCPPSSHWLFYQLQKCTGMIAEWIRQWDILSPKTIGTF